MTALLTSQSALECCSCLPVLLHPHASAPQHTTSHLLAPSSGRHEGESRHDAGAERRQQAEARFQAMEAAGAPLGTKCALCHGTEVGEEGGAGQLGRGWWVVGARRWLHASAALTAKGGQPTSQPHSPYRR